MARKTFAGIKLLVQSTCEGHISKGVWVAKAIAGGELCVFRQNKIVTAMDILIFVISVIGISAIAYFIAQSKIYQSSEIISKMDSKLTKFHEAIGGDLSMTLFCGGVLSFLCIPILYLFGFNDLIPLAVCGGILCLVFVLFFYFISRRNR